MFAKEIRRLPEFPIKYSSKVSSKKEMSQNILHQEYKYHAARYSIKISRAKKWDIKSF